ncbi:hypothetical protein NC651_033460 [Populus alba x Populus x berolinensis]|nr:hypothetical protein NC651_033460 [Populus alba x Populus x berolinensis]
MESTQQVRSELDAKAKEGEARSRGGRSTRDKLETEGYSKEEVGREFIRPATEEPAEEDAGPDVGTDADECRG